MKGMWEEGTVGSQAWDVTVSWAEGEAKQIPHLSTPRARVQWAPKEEGRWSIGHSPDKLQGGGGARGRGRRYLNQTSSYKKCPGGMLINEDTSQTDNRQVAYGLT